MREATKKAVGIAALLEPVADLIRSTQPSGGEDSLRTLAQIWSAVDAIDALAESRARTILCQASRSERGEPSLQINPAQINPAQIEDPAQIGNPAWLVDQVNEQRAAWTASESEILPGVWRLIRWCLEKLPEELRSSLGAQIQRSPKIHDEPTDSLLVSWHIADPVAWWVRLVWKVQTSRLGWPIVRVSYNLHHGRAQPRQEVGHLRLAEDALETLERFIACARAEWSERRATEQSQG